MIQFLLDNNLAVTAPTQSASAARCPKNQLRKRETFFWVRSVNTAYSFSFVYNASGKEVSFIIKNKYNYSFYYFLEISALPL